MKCVILAGGLGTRLAEETSRIPKPMVEIGGRPILWHIMKTYAAHGITDFIVCLGYRGYVVKEYFANYYLHQADVTFDLGTGGMEILRKLALGTSPRSKRRRSSVSCTDTATVPSAPMASAVK